MPSAQDETLWKNSEPEEAGPLACHVAQAELAFSLACERWGDDLAGAPRGFCTEDITILL